MEAKLLSIESHDPIAAIADEILQAKRKAGETSVKARLSATKKQKDQIKYRLMKAEFKAEQHDLGGDKWELVI